MKKTKIISFLALTLAVAAPFAQATLLGLDTAPLGSRTWSGIDYAIFDTLGPKNPSLSGYQFVDQAPSVVGSATAASKGTLFEATISSFMLGGSNSSVDRIYNGSGAGSVAFDLLIESEALSSINTVSLQMKYTLGDGYTTATYKDFFTVLLNGVAGLAEVTVSPVSDNGLPVTANQPTGIVKWTWTGLDIQDGDSFNVAITSPAAGHVSLDTIAMDVATTPVPEPHEYAIGIAALLIGLVVMRRRRTATVQ